MTENSERWSPKMEAFCQEYIVDFNGTAAAKRAGYADKGAGVQATRLLKKDNIDSRIEELLEDRRNRMRVTTDFVIGTLAQMARNERMSENARRGCLELLGKYLGLFKERVDHTSNGESMARLAIYHLPDNGRIGSSEIGESNSNGVHRNGIHLNGANGHHGNGNGNGNGKH